MYINSLLLLIDNRSAQGKPVKMFLDMTFCRN